jgi:hypothetical protein
MMRRLDPRRRIFVDEAGAHLAMAGSHLWCAAAAEYV